MNKDELQPVFYECLNCSSIWSVGTEEHEMQICSSCGWQPGEAIDDDYDYDNDDDDEFDYEPFD